MLLLRRLLVTHVVFCVYSALYYVPAGLLVIHANKNICR